MLLTSSEYLLSKTLCCLSNFVDVCVLESWVVTLYFTSCAA